MNPADGLLATVLARPEDQTPWLILSDWLEEQGDPANLARAELLRLQTQRTTMKQGVQRGKLDKRALTILAEHTELIGGLQPLVDQQFPLLSEPAALAMFLLADLTEVVAGPFVAGTTWEGELQQHHYDFPTTLWLRERTGNQFEGDMLEDFSSMYGASMDGRFYFRGVVAGRSHVAFVTYGMTGMASGPGLYQFCLSRQKRLNGTWRVGAGVWSGKMWLKQKRSEVLPDDTVSP
jgi:uncharacterized protein (TIGR02996 family)